MNYKIISACEAIKLTEETLKNQEDMVDILKSMENAIKIATREGKWNVEVNAYRNPYYTEIKGILLDKGYRVHDKTVDSGSPGIIPNWIIQWGSEHGK